MGDKSKSKEQKIEKEHVKKHDHSFLGKHNKKQKRQHYEELNKKENTTPQTDK